MNPYRSGRRLTSVSDWPEIVYSAKSDQDFIPVSQQRTRSQIWNLERPSMPSLSAYNITRISSKVEDNKTENKTCVVTRIWVRENGGSLDSNFISLLNSAIDENWVCRHRLLQFIFRKWCRVWCSNLCKLFVNGKFTTRSHILCARTDLLLIIFICSLYSPWATIRLLHHFDFVYVLILGYAVHIFCATDAKYVMFCVGWHKSLKGSATPVYFLVTKNTTFHPFCHSDVLVQVTGTLESQFWRPSSTTRSARFPAWKSCTSSLIRPSHARVHCLGQATTSEAMLFGSYDDVVFCILHDATDDNMRGSCTCCRQHSGYDNKDCPTAWGR